MKITDISTDEDRKNRIIRIDTTPDEVNLSFSLETSADNA